MSDEQNSKYGEPDANGKYRYFNKNNNDVVEYDRPHVRLEYLQNWVRVRDDQHLEELTGDQTVSGRGNLLGSSNVGDRIEPRHQVPDSTFEPKVEFTEPSHTQLPGQHPDPEDFHPEKQPEVITVDPSQQVQPKTGENKRELTVVDAPAPVEPAPQRVIDAQSDETFADNPTTETGTADTTTPHPSDDPDNASGDGTEPIGPNPAERPARSATKGEWVDWAVKCGADRSEAEGMTKTDLIEVYGD